MHVHQTSVSLPEENRQRLRNKHHSVELTAAALVAGHGRHCRAILAVPRALALTSTESPCTRASQKRRMTCCNRAPFCVLRLLVCLILHQCFVGLSSTVVEVGRRLALVAESGCLTRCHRVDTTVGTEARLGIHAIDKADFTLSLDDMIDTITGLR